MHDFDAQVETDHDVPVVAVTGDLDADAGPTLHEAYEAATADDPDALVLDFSELGFMNSSGIAHVVSLLGDAREGDVDVRACGLDEHYEHVFEITRLADFITVCADRQEATTTSARTPTTTEEKSP